MAKESYRSFLDWRFFFGVGMGLFIGSLVLLQEPAKAPEAPPLTNEEILARAAQLGMVQQEVYSQSAARIQQLEGELQTLRDAQAQGTAAPKQEDNPQVTIVIPEGSNSEDIMALLIDAGVEINPGDFEREVNQRGIGSRFRKGTFTVGKKDSLDAIFAKLTG